MPCGISTTTTVISVDEPLEAKAWEVFGKQTKKGTSFVDCANLACAQHYHFDAIVSLDTFYPKNLRIAA